VVELAAHRTTTIPPVDGLTAVAAVVSIPLTDALNQLRIGVELLTAAVPFLRGLDVLAARVPVQKIVNLVGVAAVVPQPHVH